MNPDSIKRFLKQYPVIVGASLVILLTLVYQFLLAGGDEALSSRQEALQRELRYINANSKFSVGLEEDVEKMDQYVSQISEHLMNKKQEILNLGYFYELERLTGASVITAEQLSEEDAYTQKTKLPALQHFLPIGFEMTIEGNYEQIAAFLYHLLHDRFWTYVHEFELSGGQEARSSNPQASLEIFILGEKPANEQ